MRNIALVLIFLLATLQGFAQPKSFNRNGLDSFLQYMVENNKFMGTVTLSHQGKVFYDKQFGFIDERKSPPKDNTTYRVGSISKTFTSIMILQLVDEGKLDLSAPLSGYFPDIPNAGDITIKNMLNHSSGIHSLTEGTDYLKWCTEERSRQDLVKMIEGFDPDFKPGEKHQYSNSNFVLLGYIIEEITGKPYGEALEERIVKKLDLKNTYAGSPHSKEAFSFRNENGEWELESRTNMSIPGGAGAVASTTEDLVRFLEGIFNGELISASSLEEMTFAEKTFGLGIFKMPFYLKQAYGHNGGIDGFQSMMAYFPEDTLAFAMDANALSYSLNNLSLGILSMVYNIPFEFPQFQPAIELPEKELKKFTGTYSSETLPLEIFITEKEGKLFGRATGQPDFPLTPVSTTTFTFDPAGVKIEFSEIKKNKYNSLILFQGGGKILFNRK